MSGFRKWLWPAVTGVAGLAAGLLIGAHRAASPAVAFMPGPAEPHTGLTADDVRLVVREELAARGPASEAAPAVQPSAPQATTQQVVAASEAQSVLEGAIARRSWTEQDADAMRDVFPNLSSDQQAEFLRQYSVAVNQGRLAPQTERVPF